jgi:hypothetical protein
MGSYVEGKIQDALHFAPPILCPSVQCRRRICTSSWEPLVQAGVRARYHTNAAALLTIRCPACDLVSSLLAELDLAAGTQAAEERVFGLGGASELTREASRNFSEGEASAMDLLAALLRDVGEDPSEHFVSERLLQQSEAWSMVPRR